MSLITLSLKSKKNKQYDLNKAKDSGILKRLITLAINEKDTSRLKEIKQKLETIKKNSFCETQLSRIQGYLTGDLNNRENVGNNSEGEEDADNLDAKYDELITDEHLFPRCEYYTRFEGTTAFAMDNPSYWNTYHRSQSSRFYSLMGKKAKFSSPFLNEPKGSHSFYSHVGGYRSPFDADEYANSIKLETEASEGSINIRDKLLVYKNSMAEIIVSTFKKLGKNKQKIKFNKEKIGRPVVHKENEYPCVLVSLPIINSSEVQTETAKYWREHPKPFQNLIICTFIAFLNIEAMKEEIPIEMVLRSSFGHNLPSVCETGKSFRINVGIIPKCYAVLIGKTLHKLNEIFSNLTEEKSEKIKFDKNFLDKIEKYNAVKKKLWEKKKSKGNLIPVDLKDKTIWEIIRTAGDSMGKPVLSECFRKNATQDWLVNQIMNSLCAGDKNPIETSLINLLKCIKYEEKVGMDYEKIHNELKSEKRKFSSLSFKKFYDKYPEFSEVVSILFEGLFSKRPTHRIYKALEHDGVDFFIKYKGNKEVKDEADYGSDSEFETKLKNQERKKKTKIFHSKLRLCSGMKAILLAHYGATYFLSKSSKNYSEDIKQMYYEVESALKLVKKNSLNLNKIRASGESSMLYFDLNHCNAANKTNETLDDRLNENPAVVILDYTSSTYSQVKKALRKCFSKQAVKLVMLASSDLKNNQFGSDINPYGEVRVIGKEKQGINEIIEKMKEVLSKNDKLSSKIHEKVRACKKRGLAFSLFGLFKTEKARFQPIEKTKDLKCSG